MGASAPTAQRSLATPGEVADFLGGDFSEKTLANWRSDGKGPKYHKIGRHVRYDWADVMEWLAERRTCSGAV
jgi:predicted DNA-binding transcriptional regulator AlpA